MTEMYNIHHDILCEEPAHKPDELLDGTALWGLFGMPVWGHIHSVPWALDGIPSLALFLAPWHSVLLAHCGTFVPWLVYTPDAEPWYRLAGHRVYKFVLGLFCIRGLERTN